MVVVGSLLFAALLAVILKKKIEYVVGASLTLLIFISELFIVLDLPAIGTCLITGIEFASLCGLLYILVKRRDSFKEYVLTYGCIAISVFMILLMYYSMGRQAIYGPDPLFWVGSIKKMYISNSSQVLDGIIHPYLLFSLGYMGVKSWPRWAEGILLFSKDFYAVSLIIPLFSIVEKKAKSNVDKIVSVSSLFIMIMLIPFIGSGDGFGIFCVDSLMAELIAIGLVFLCEALEFDSRKDFFICVIYFAAAVLTKRIAVLAVAMLFLFIIPFLKNKGKNKWGIILTITTFLSYVVLWQFNLYVMPLLAGVVVSYLFTWTKSALLRIKINNKLLFLMLITAFVFALVITKRWLGTDWFDNDVFRIYIKGLFTTYKYTVGSVIPLSIAAIILGSGLIYICIIRLSSQQDLKNIFLCILCSHLLYVAVFGYLYVWIIAPANYEANGQYIAAFDRYMSYIVVTEVIYLIYALIKVANSRYYIVSSLFCLILLCDMEKPFKYFTMYESQYKYYGFEDQGITLEDDDVVAYIDMDSIGYVGYRIYAFELMCLPNTVVYVDMDRYTDEDGVIDLERLGKSLDWCDYIYIQYADEQVSSLIDEESGTGNVYVYDTDLNKLVLANKK
ncbi:hypothetical protein [Butyrivibrio fibrisolvens]|uniref:hypothetical protein n=1 Tax=Butyrivibrio fibrisolvens TaxID=831 RepID=UPI00041F4797|nr:hypothetical protein [Butyrivibrio fibrisolvens]